MMMVVVVMIVLMMMMMMHVSQWFGLHRWSVYGRSVRRMAVGVTGQSTCFIILLFTLLYGYF